MRLAVPKERRATEARVAATPETVRKLIGLGLSVAVEKGAGLAAGIPDAAYAEAGAEIAPDAAAVLAGAGIVLKVRAPLAAGEGEVDEIALIPEGAVLIGTLEAASAPERNRAYAARRITACAMELAPRITRAQSMDVLSSQANLAGYRAVIEAAGAFDRGFPMLMTAAGTIPAANVLVLGAGVAGLQAIATARRLGGRVSASDVRPAAKEEIKSLGASFVGVEDEESAAAQTAGGYAKAMSPEYLRKQAEVVAAAAARADIVICTALVQGRKAPVLLTEAMVAAMKPGAVVVDIAADAGGNCAATVPGEAVTTENGVKVLGWRNWPARIPAAASSLYARNLLTFLTTFWDKEAGMPKLPEEDEIVRGVLLTRGGAVVHPQFQNS
ncbi:NAD(P) transhydrogenase alpha subunit [Roseomonas mucosa]|uniref:proton-translocating NAD(P)(+) transhydrogenase n=1 Tax=Roseomonas mucosa TaxID=207340 RepID=A0A379N217_9PROT|nr:MULTISPECIES: Re/Si-specific NAD(P)(+) transhydrogenase subunit alpha [Roseomonas]MBS5904317.1 Re/Si-specific NAD(P)(+) transhydrogenase subunit alpha [Acetobacteraceae bacterium]MCG7352286.1 Re/Si-specific NAD(P)(+) transhydrogenase subunit alpha [Roseomonas mucosa]MCG7357178.1 Re/Si-specific NAD(P)(+) transhydrogenase subunit alpha [Roseomonas mucosa]MDT8291186.1 Re/Si-specific NAD(P)(+) transhydrogenase subunit alpha [Roseomonas mucosa]MDT8294806.1 Re/Si-specific NAD(P)(+) transhydrogena